jgi:hypothetical protein
MNEPSQKDLCKESKLVDIALNDLIRKETDVRKSPCLGNKKYKVCYITLTCHQDLKIRSKKK